MIGFIGLDDTILTDEIAGFVAVEEKCSIEEVKVGTIQAMRNLRNWT